MSLTLSEFVCPTADLGPENPHAALRLPFPVLAHYEGTDLPVEHCLPYRQFDGYSRELKTRSHKVAILESDTLRATFLLNLGGRLWSLVHKPSGRELLYVNPVIQFANFGIRDAWFSGGIEWNVGIFGHSVFTCAPVFAARTRAPDGSDGLRLWEYERLRQVVWQVDFWAPDGSDFLFWSPRILNSRDETLPMYWWTCVAVPEVPGGRVLAPADRAIEPGHAMGEETLVRNLIDEPDVTYPQGRALPKDTYFEIDGAERPWIAHVEPSGGGVVHVSDSQLCGRKQWVWGMNACGRRWQEWLSPSGPPYIEIQGGLAPRQSHYVPMPAQTVWSWLEAFGPLDGIDTSEWSSGIRQARTELERLLPRESFAEAGRALKDVQRVAPLELLNLGSGWGALEAKARRFANGDDLAGPETPFPEDALGQDQSFWSSLLEAFFVDPEPSMHPGGYMSDPAWSDALRALASIDSSPKWLRLLHEGVYRFASGDRNSARWLWEAAVDAKANGWSVRNLAILDDLDGDLRRACERILEAHALLPEDRTIVAEACRLLAAAEEFEMLGRFCDELSPSLSAHPRVRLARAQIALARRDLQPVRDYFDVPCDLVDLREAETTVSDLWRGLCELDAIFGDPDSPPAEWDFRMR